MSKEKTNRRRLGGEMEAGAAKYLRDAGYDVVESNFRCKFGEIDIIVFKENTYVFVEVKYRAGTGSGYGSEAVSLEKQKRICRTADYFRMKNGIYGNVGFRFDVISIDGDKVTHFENAFPYRGTGW